MNKPYMTKRHLVLEILSYVLLLVCFIIAIVGMATLPDEIPTHFTMSGEIDGCRTDFADTQNKKECGGNRQWQRQFLRKWAANTKGKAII